MSAPFLLVQLSDPHIGAQWGGRDPAQKLAAAVAVVTSMDPAPGAVLISGDLAEHADDAEYEQLKALLAPIGAPLYVLPGNHDDRAALRRHFALPGGAGELVQYSADLGALRLAALDTTVPGEEGGRLDGERLEWLDAELAASAATPTAIAMHHPPLITGMPSMDAVGLPQADTEALAAVLDRHPQVIRLLAGHVHRAVTGSLDGRAVVIAPSTFVQLALDFRSEEISLADEPAAFAVHALVAGELVSHVKPVA